MKEEGENASLKLNIHKTKIKASGPIISWQVEGEKAETVTDFILFSWPPKSLWTVTAAMKLKDICSLELKKKAMTNLRLHSKKAETSLCQQRHLWPPCAPPENYIIEMKF